MLTISLDDVGYVEQCFKKTNGVAVWSSANLSNPGLTWVTEIGAGKPSWQANSQPSEIITSRDDIKVNYYRQVNSFRVAVRPSSNGLTTKLTDASSRRVRKAVEKAGAGAYYRFDYEYQRAIILAPFKSITLTEYMEG